MIVLFPEPHSVRNGFFLWNDVATMFPHCTSTFALLQLLFQEFGFSDDNIAIDFPNVKHADAAGKLSREIEEGHDRTRKPGDLTLWPSGLFIPSVVIAITVQTDEFPNR